MRNSEVLDRLQKLINYMPRQKEISDKTGINQNTLSAKATRDSHWKDEEIQKLNAAYNVDIYKEISQNTTEDCIFLDYYPEVFGSCGSGTFVLSEQKEIIQVPKRLFDNFSKTKTYSVINAVGESMMPNIQDKDRLIVEHWNGEQIMDNQIYVFCYKEEIFTKRLIKNVDEIIIKSDNPDPIYRPRFIEKDDMNNIILIGRIVGLMREF